MIGSLRGPVLGVDYAKGEALIEAGGVGYRVTMSAAGIRRLPDSGAAFVFIHHAIREADQHLYGFTTLEERACFESLLAAHGVGPSLAMAVVATHSPADLFRIVAHDDVEALRSVPGVGPKTAARLLIELKNRLNLPDDLSGVVAAMSDGRPAPASAKSDVIQALTGLGYGHDEIRSVVANLPSEGEVSYLLKMALQQLAMSL